MTTEMTKSKTFLDYINIYFTKKTVIKFVFQI